MADNRINMPAGFGGLVRFDEEYKSKIMIEPVHVVAFVIATIAFRILLGIWLG